MAGEFAVSESPDGPTGCCQLEAGVISSLASFEENPVLGLVSVMSGAEYKPELPIRGGMPSDWLKPFDRLKPAGRVPHDGSENVEPRLKEARCLTACRNSQSFCLR